MIKKLRITVSLNGIVPLISRELELPSNMRGVHFATLIQLAMGWEFEHMYEFHAGKKTYAGVEDDNKADMASLIFRGRSANKLPLSEVTVLEMLQEARQAKAPLVFIYDFGDWWEHTIALEEASDYDEGESREAKLITGHRACPPEDCGSVPGYMELVEAMENPSSPRAKELIDWLGYRYKPDVFPKKRTTEAIARFNKTYPPEEEIVLSPEEQAQKDILDRMTQEAAELPRVGRNDPCPCGSGKKYKQCHGKYVN